MEEIIKMIEEGQIVNSTILTVLTSLITLAIAGIVRRGKKIKGSVSQDELKEGIDEAKKYTDDKMNNHEMVHKEIHVQYTQIQSDLSIIKGYLINKQ